MAITIKCPDADCGVAHHVANDLSGKRLKCRVCGSTVTVPNIDPGLPTPAFPTATTPGERCGTVDLFPTVTPPRGDGGGRPPGLQRPGRPLTQSPRSVSAGSRLFAGWAWGIRVASLPSSFELTRASSPGIEPGLRPSRGRVRIRHTPKTCCNTSAPPRNRTPSCGLEDRRAVRHTHRALSDANNPSRGPTGN